MEDYVLQYGDTLEKIASEKLGNVNRWREIAEINKLQNADNLLIGQKLKIPKNSLNISSDFLPNQNLDSNNTPANQIPASLALARGYMFVVFEQLPEVGSKNVIRKVAIIPKDYSLFPKNPLAKYSPAEHALMGNILETQYLSTSNKPFGSPTMPKQSLKNPKGWNELLLIDTDKAQSGGAKIIRVEELVADLRRHAIENPKAQNQIRNLINAIEKIEGETLIEGSVPGNAVKRVSTAHSKYIATADELVAQAKRGAISEQQLYTELESLGKSYKKAKIFGRVGRVLTVVGVVFTAVDVADAAQKSYDKGSFKPLAAETVRQVGGWGGAMAGAKIGFWVGAAFGIETGPGAIVTGAVGAIVFGAIGYFAGDYLAGWIDPPEETTTALRKDVRSTDNLAEKGITLIVGQNETQYMFCRRALMQAAFNAGLLTEFRQREYADKFYSLAVNAEKATNFQMTWVGKDPSPNDAKNIKSAEFNQHRGRQLTYYLNQQEIDELIKLILRGY